MEYNKLLLSWKGPISKNNFLVGVLEKNGQNYIFYYNLTEVEKANEEGFKPFIGLSNVEKKYKSEKLFPVFERRLPHHTRSVFKKFIADNKLEMSEDINWDYLTLTRGRLATDSLSFLTPILFKDGRIYYSFEVAGWSYTKDKNRVLEVEDKLSVSIDFENPKDKCAVELTDPKNNYERVGFIPRPFNEFFYNLLLDESELQAVIVGILGEDARPNVFTYTLAANTNITPYKQFQYLFETK